MQKRKQRKEHRQRRVNTGRKPTFQGKLCRARAYLCWHRNRSRAMTSAHREANFLTLSRPPTHMHALDYGCWGTKKKQKKRERQLISFLPSRIGRTCSFFAQTSQPCRRDASFAPARWDAHEQVLSEPANSGSLSLSLRSHPVPTIQSTMTRCLRLVGTASRNTKHG